MIGLSLGHLFSNCSFDKKKVFLEILTSRKFDVVVYSEGKAWISISDEPYTYSLVLLIFHKP